MKIVLATLILIVSINGFANSKPCLTQARQIIVEKIESFDEGADCDIKLRMLNLTEDMVSYSAKISCITDGGFFDMTDLIVMKFEKLSSRKYKCQLQ